MKKIFIILLSALSLTAFAQDVKKVAILETVDKVGDVPYGINLQLRSSLTYAVSNTPGFEGYDRTDMASIMGEHDFQRTGMVDETQIKRLGVMTGAQFVLIAEVAIYDEQNIIITAKVLDVETGGIVISARPVVANKAPDKMDGACVLLAGTLLKETPQHSSQWKDIPEGYVDLGLPSGTIWKIQNEEGYYSYENAMGKFGINLPSKEQWSELKAFCKWTWIENGYKVVGKNGASIFLPITGFRGCDGRRGDLYERGWYWSSTSRASTSGRPSYASCLRFSQEEGIEMNADSYCTEQSCRLVQSLGYVDLGLPSGTLWRDKNEEEELTFEGAMAKYGASLPTKAQWEELLNECKWTWVDPGEWEEFEGELYRSGDDPYYLIKGKNGNSITLPASGYLTDNGDLCYGCGGLGGIVGSYYSSTADDKEKTYYCFNFQNNQKSLEIWEINADFFLRTRLVSIY